jgi:hypothetical protein
LHYTPAKDLTNTHAPVLAITGTKDIQIDPAELDGMAGLVKGEFVWASSIRTIDLIG